MLELGLLLILLQVMALQDLEAGVSGGVMTVEKLLILLKVLILVILVVGTGHQMML